MIQTIKVPIRGFYQYLHLFQHGDRLYIKFKYNKTLLAEVKSMGGARWHPDTGEFPPEVAQSLACDKCWSVENCDRNWTAIKILQGDDPFAIYCEMPEPIPAEARLTSSGKLLAPYPHQCLMTGHHLGLRRVITAAEMGTGKTLAAIMTMERAENFDERDFWYVSTRSGLMATQYELQFWKAHVVPMLFTYEELVRTLKHSPKIRPPQLIIFDESAAIKNMNAQRTQAAKFITDAMRRFCQDPYIIEMSGAPAPQSPIDWWAQAEIAAPGFLREGDANKFGKRLSFTEVGHNGAYLKRVSWRDNPEKCDFCGELHSEHTDKDHEWAQSVDEVRLLGKRLSGLVLTVRKADVLKWLPEKIFRELQLKPRPETLRAAKMIANMSVPVIQKLTMLRTLSDGFRYVDEEAENASICPSCLGKLTIQDYDPEKDEIGEVQCPQCKGSGTVHAQVRKTVLGPCPKDDTLRDLLEECEPKGRIVIYGGFTGTVDRCVNVLTSSGWDVIRADGRGWHAFGPSCGLIKPNEWLKVFQEGQIDLPKLGFIAQAGAAGTGLTLTASEMLVYYSNDFDANHRIQSMDRIHRPGCTGAVIVDLLHLPSDRVVLDALNRKQDLQKLVLDANIFEVPDGDSATAP